LRIVFFFFHRKNDFAEVSKNLAGYRTKNNFVEIIKIQWVLKLLERLENFVWAYIQCDIY